MGRIEFNDYEKLEEEKKELQQLIKELENKQKMIQNECGHQIVLITRKVDHGRGITITNNECLYCRKQNVLRQNDRNQKTIDISNYKTTIYKDNIEDTEKKINRVRNLFRKNDISDVIMILEHEDYASKYIEKNKQKVLVNEDKM